MNSSLLEGLNEEQRRAVTHERGPLLIVAGAGTGKTTVITRRIAYLIEQGLAKPDEILALTFTEKAAEEMQERVDQLLPLGHFDMWVSTFHSFCQRILEAHALEVGLPHRFKLLDETGQWMLVHKNFEKFNFDYYKPLGNPYRFIDALLQHFSRCKDEIITPEDYLSFAESLRLEAGSVDGPDTQLETSRIRELSEAYHTYQQLLLQNNALDFGDLIHYCVRLFRTRPNILAYYQKLFEYILVDEFQDTNIAQYELVKLLCNTQSTNLTVVGDDDQSIYKFRGASASNILHFKKDFPNLTECTLTLNYRSNQEILDLAYTFIQQNNPDRLEVSLGINKRLVNPAHVAAVKAVAVLEGKDISDELGLVIRSIITIKATNPEGTTWNDFAILFRSNSAAPEIVSRLEAEGIPYIYLSNTGLYKKPLVADLLAYCKLLDNYHEPLGFYKVFDLPKFKIEQHELSTITRYAHQKTISIFEALGRPELRTMVTEHTVTVITRLLEMLDSHSKRASRKSAVEIVAEIIQDLGILQLLESDTLENAQNREFLEQFYKEVQRYGEDAEDRSLKGFLHYIELKVTSGNEGEIKFDPNSGPEAVKILTVHASKGLEFEHVFIVGLVDQRFPTRERKDVIEIPTQLIKDILPVGNFHLQEERRLMYVALTRAKRSVFLSWAKDYGGARAKKPSIFLSELGLVAKHDARSQATGKVAFRLPSTRKPSALVYREMPKTFSYSAINAFLRCPLEYKYVHYLRLPFPGSSFMSFGITIHKVFEEYMKEWQRRLENQAMDLFGKTENPKLPDMELLKHLYAENWVDDWYPTKQDKEMRRAKGVEFLETFYNWTQANVPRPKYLEESFSLRFAEFQFHGKIDRADIGANGLAIIDYKTGKPPKTNSREEVDQLLVYQLAAQNFLGQKVESLAYWYMDEQQPREIALAGTDELLELEERLLGVMRTITDTIRYDRFKELDAEITHTCTFADD